MVGYVSIALRNILHQYNKSSSTYLPRYFENDVLVWSKERCNGMYKYKFSTTKKAANYLDEIVAQLVALFNISHQEAVGRINRHWSNITHFGNDDMLFHMLPYEWAHEVYYGHGTPWWRAGDKNDLIPLPFYDEE
jgi:hypothetical protein